MAHGARRALLWSLLAATVAALAGIGAASWRAVGRRAPPREPSPVELRVAAWAAEGLRPGGSAAERLAAGRAALAADRPEGELEAARHFQMALALDPSRVEALAGWILASASAPDADLEQLRDGHALAAWALERNPGRGDLLAAWARLLLLVPGERGPAEAARRRANGETHVIRLAMPEHGRSAWPAGAVDLPHRQQDTDPGPRGRALPAQ